jgi:hypothetical protein
MHARVTGPDSRIGVLVLGQLQGGGQSPGRVGHVLKETFV